MAKNRIRKKRRPKKKSQQGSSSQRKKILTQDEMLARIPMDKDWLDTPDVQHIFNDAHEVTIYKWVGNGELKAYRVKNRGKTNLYKRDDVIALIHKRCTPRPASISESNMIRESNTHDDEDPTGNGSPTGATPQPTKARAKKRRKARGA